MKKKYFDLESNWTDVIASHLGNAELNEILIRDFSEITLLLWNIPFVSGMYPGMFDRRSSWLPDSPDPQPRYFRYVVQHAAFKLVNFSLKLATLAVPKEKWRIIHSDDHSTVWSGKNLLFDFNLLALGVPADICFDMAYDEELRPGEYF